MRPLLAPATLLTLALAISPSSAQQQYCPPRPIYVPQAPNACGPGYYYYNDCGLLYGPNYCLRPPFEPFQGMLKGPQGPGGKPGQGYPGASGAPGSPPPQMLKQYTPKELAALQRLPDMQALARFQGGPPPLPGMPALPKLPAPPAMGIPGIVQPPRYINHPFARSPRDFFMLD